MQAKNKKFNYALRAMKSLFLSVPIKLHQCRTENSFLEHATAAAACKCTLRHQIYNNNRAWRAQPMYCHVFMGSPCISPLM